MSTQKTQPPWEFLFSASPFTLHSYELSRLNHAANLRKEMGRLLDQWLEENACAMLARWLIEQRERSVRDDALGARPGEATASDPAAPGLASDNFLTESGRPHEAL